MDLFDLLIIALLALPALLRGLERAAKRRKAGESPDTETPTFEPSDEESDFHRALREIGLVLAGDEEALGKARREAETPPEPEYSPRPQRSPAASPPAFAREEAFEARSDAARLDATVPFRSLKMAKIEATRAEQTPGPAAGRRDDIKRMLRNPKYLRDAVILAEILGSPRAPTIRG